MKLLEEPRICRTTPGGEHNMGPLKILRTARPGGSHAYDLTWPLLNQTLYSSACH